MKKIILLIFLSVAIKPLFAQTVKFGIKAGLNESTIDIGSSQDNANKTTSRAGFNAGAFAEFQFNSLSIEPGLFYTIKGANYISSFTRNNPQNSVQQAVTMKAKTTYNYLELPLNVLYNIKVAPGKIFVGGGPYWAMALSGNENSTTTVDGSSTTAPETKLSFGGDSGLKRADFGLNALAGITLKNGLLFSADYGYGLTDVLKFDNSQIKHRVLSFSVGYSFL